jgi:hypothetical protein
MQVRAEQRVVQGGLKSLWRSNENIPRAIRKILCNNSGLHPIVRFRSSNYIRQ